MCTLCKYTRHLPCWFYLKSHKTPSFLCCANHTCNETCHPHKEWCAKLQTEFTFSAMAVQETGGWLSPPRRTLCLLERSVCWRQGRLAGGTELTLHTGASAQCLSSKHPSLLALGTGHTALGVSFNALSMPNNQIYLIWSKQHFPFCWLPFPRQWCQHFAMGAHPLAPHGSCLDSPGCPHREHCPTWMQEWTKLGTDFPQSLIFAVLYSTRVAAFLKTSLGGLMLLLVL